MLKLTPKERVLFVRKYMLALLVLVGVFSLSIANFGRSPQLAHATAASTINFQARLQTNTGAIVPDGDYNVEFKIYDAATSSGSSQGSCASDGHCLWVETRISTNRVHVTNGYLTVNLGSVNGFSGINWDQKLWMTMNIGGTSGSPSWDGEMSPRLSLTAVPFAFASGQLNTTDVGGRSTLTVQGSGSGHGDQNFVIQDQGAAGTYNLLTRNQADASYIQLQGATPGTAQTGNINISGTGLFGTALVTPSLDAGSGTLTIAGSNASTVNIANNASAHTINIGTGAAAQAITVGSTNTTSATVIQGGANGILLNTGAGSGDTGSIALISGNSSAGVAGSISLDTGTGLGTTTVTGTPKTFESGLDNMADGFGYSDTVTSSTTLAHGGTHSLKVITGCACGFQLGEGAPFTSTGMHPFHTYKFGAWVRSGGGFNSTYSMTAVWSSTGYAGGGEISEVVWGSGTETSSGWTQITGTLLAPAGTTSVAMIINANAGSVGEAHYIDDITIEDVSSSMSGIGIGATNAQSILIGNTTNTSAITIDAGASSTLNIANSATTHTVNIATGAANQTVNLGSTSGASATTVQGGTGGAKLQTGAISSASASGAINIMTGDNTGAGNSGAIIIQSGAASSGTSGNIIIDTGASASSSGANLEHDTFETSVNGWGDYFNTTSYVTSSTFAEAGTKSLKFTTSAGSWGAVSPWPGPAVTPGTLYNVSLWVRSNTAGTVKLWALWQGGADDTLFATDTDSNTGWTQLHGTVLAPAGVTNLQLMLSGVTANGDTVYVDEVVMSGGSASPSISIGGANAAAVVIGSRSAAGSTQIQGGSGGVSISTADGNAINVGTDGDSVITIGNSLGTETLTLQGNGITHTVAGSASAPSDTIKTSINSTIAFRIQNSNGDTLLNADTSNSTIKVSGTTSTFAIFQLDNAHFRSTQTNAPTIGTPTNCATSPSAAVTSGSTDAAGSFTVTVGSGGSQTTCDTVVTFNKAYGAAPKSVLLSPTKAVGSATAVLPAQVNATSTTTFTVQIAPNTAANSGVYSYYYWVIE
jgi:hypothetical protein